MKKGYLGLYLVILLTTVIKAFDSAPDTDFPILKTEDAESLLATNRKIDFATADEFELQMITNVGDTLSKNLLNSRALILIRASKLPCSEVYKSLTSAHGVGEKTALKLITYLDLGESGRCM